MPDASTAIPFPARHGSVRDLGSRNGTRVNGLRVLDETEVRPGDRLSLGDVRFRLVLRRAANH